MDRRAIARTNEREVRGYEIIPQINLVCDLRSPNQNHLRIAAFRVESGRVY